MTKADNYFEYVRSTGRWDHPRLWKIPGYITSSPWDRTDLREAFTALQAIYPPDFVKRAFIEAGKQGERVPWFWTLITDPFRPDLSAKLALGFDAAHGKIREHPQLIKNLQRQEQFNGARLELRMLAALERAQLQYEYEPFATEKRKTGHKAKNPDFRINLGEWVTVDVKHLQISNRSERAQQRFFKIMFGQNDNWGPLEAAVRLLPRYSELEASTASQDRLDGFAKRLHDRIAHRISWMKENNVKRWCMAGVVQLDLDEPHHQQGGPIDAPGDANRVVGRLAEGAGQILSKDFGLLIVEISRSEPLYSVFEAVTEWLRGPEQHIVGVAIIADHYVPGVRQFVRGIWPFWRDSAPQRIQRRHQWECLFRGLNWFSFTAEVNR